MKLLIRQVRILDPQSSFYRQQADLLLENGTISAIGSALSGQADRIIELPALSVSPGWMDPFAFFADPGFEYKETLETGAAAAAAGGYTDVLLLPNTAPVVHNKAAVEYIVQRSKSLPVNLYPIGAVTKSAEGKELSEMYDMHQSGALAFGDGWCSIQSSGILLKALQYLKAINGVLVQVPDDRSISAHGLMNEGVVSTRLGLPGKPALAEELMIARDLELVRYTGSRIHFTGISTRTSVDLIRAAKNEGLNVSCSVSPFHLYFCDADLETYDTNLKFNPPLRTPEDRTALRQAVLDGTIDCIASHHMPHEKDSKVVEFEYAKNGSISLETAYAAVRSSLPQITAERMVELFCIRPREIFGLPVPLIREGEKACLTLFQENTEWVVGRNHIFSKSDNTPFPGTTLTGKPLGIIHKEGVFLNV